MKKVVIAFVVLLAICLIIVACAKKEEVERPAETIPEPAAEEVLDTTEVVDTVAATDTTAIDSAVVDTAGH